VPAASGDAGVDAVAGADAEPVQWGGSGTDDDPSGSSVDDGAGAGDAAEGTEAADGDDTEHAAGGAGSGGAGSTPGDEPAEFRTVMRLLGNREFPVERGSVVELAASAYDLDEAHVNRILDHAVDRGVIVDDGGTLRRD
jgi:hypothetical protein